MFSKYIKLLESASNGEERSQLEIELVEFLNEEKGDDYEYLSEHITDVSEFVEAVELLIDSNKKEAVHQLCDLIDVEMSKHRFNGNAYLIIFSNGVSLLFHENAQYTSYETPDDIVYDINDDDILSLFGYEPEAWSREFWSQPITVYHATTEEKWEEIQASSVLEARNESRGISNSSTREAVFVTQEVEELDIGTYGDVHLSINMKEMKSDGYMPTTVEEKPVVVDRYREALSSLFDVEYTGHASDGVFHSTLVIFGDIPLKYVERIDR